MELINSYFNIVKEPMDLETSRSKLSSGQYISRQDFFEDMEKIVHNCIIYNGENNDIGRAAKQFRGVFHKRKSQSYIVSCI